ncbi:class I SAM-dependent methyltransferase [Echinicola jeungdonensis]|uniref:THUMP-like domain-containing protein n=1 Tax=Echinicola jeungdonensis TaxID=709343 RepID=UPI0025B41D9E|nr:class I SAM-dependent methyltransferase [Echinicola jeungdonensis]MDN3668725.1 class I SAM-dependent methyltransferase [Echinicola jeungdonensis]
MQDHLQEDPAQLLLRHGKITAFDLKAAIKQISARQKVKQKLPFWVGNKEVIFPDAVPLEQCSSELTAKFKAKKVKGACLADLTGGMGVDTFYLSSSFGQVDYVERNEELAQIAQWNFHVLHTQPDKITFHQGESMEFLKNSFKSFDCLFIDPARRGDQNQKLYKLADCEPNVVENWQLMTGKAKQIMIKASPMLDIKAAINELPEVNQVMVVAVKNEVKEVLLLWDEQKSMEEVKVSSYELSQEPIIPFEFTYGEEESASLELANPESYLFEPSAAILKAGAFKSFAHHYSVKKLHPNTHLYTGKWIPTGLQGKTFEILEPLKLDKRTVKKTFPNKIANVVVRNHPMKAAEIKKKFQLKDGGHDFLIAFTGQDNKPVAFRCKRIQ